MTENEKKLLTTLKKVITQIDGIRPAIVEAISVIENDPYEEDPMAFDEYKDRKLMERRHKQETDDWRQREGLDL